ncbi:hypothetical protein [Streptomyces sp. NPDC003480]
MAADLSRIRTAAGSGPARATGAMTTLLTCAMAFPMAQPFLIGALGPRLVDDLDVSPTAEPSPGQRGGRAVSSRRRRPDLYRAEASA